MTATVLYCLLGTVNLIMSKILIAEVKKKAKFGNDETWYRNSFVSFDRDKLKDKIEDFYNVDLVKDNKNEFPYFTDGGFKYSGENEYWLFETEAHWHDII